MPGCPGSVVRCINRQISQPAVTIANAVRNDLVKALGDNNCYRSMLIQFWRGQCYVTNCNNIRKNKISRLASRK